jgi:hypothetical protein
MHRPTPTRAEPGSAAPNPAPRQGAGHPHLWLLLPKISGHSLNLQDRKAVQSCLSTWILTPMQPDATGRNRELKERLWVASSQIPVTRSAQNRQNATQCNGESVFSGLSPNCRLHLRGRTPARSHVQLGLGTYQSTRYWSRPEDAVQPMKTPKSPTSKETERTQITLQRCYTTDVTTMCARLPSTIRNEANSSAQNPTPSTQHRCATRGARLPPLQSRAWTSSKSCAAAT